LAADRALLSEGSLQSADGTRLAYRAWPSAGNLTLAVIHGLGEHAGRYARFAEGMAKHRASTYALDLRGHGKSAGQRGHVDSWTQWTEDAAAFIAHVESIAHQEVVPVGHSFGGVVLLSTVLAGKLPNTTRFVVSSPALRPKVTVPAWKVKLGGVASKIAPRFALDNEVDPKTVSRIPEVVEAYRNDPLVHSKISGRLFTEWRSAASDVLNRAAEFKLSFLILAGTDDSLIDPADSRELHARTASVSELHMLPARYHEPFNDIGSEEVFALIAGWLNR
jgi:alpha-beta hydrolase superfamily lysophospholipase